MAGIPRELVVPDDMVDEILVRVPAKSIVRFESVSKEWHSKLRSTSFKELYDQRSKPYNNDNHTIKLGDLYKMAPKLQHHNIGVVGAVYRRLLGRPIKPAKAVISSMGPLSNGIYCLTSVPEVGHLSSCKIVLCNPGIGQFKFLPPFPSRFRSKLARAASFHRWDVVFGFDMVPCCLGLDYRVVFIVNYGTHVFLDHFLVFVYSSNSGEWESLVDHKPGQEVVSSATEEAFARIRDVGPGFETCSRVLLNGCWHWIVFHDDYCLKVLAFHFAHKSFQLINGPPAPLVNAGFWGASVFVLHAHLALITTHVVDEIEYDVWMMTDYGVNESWVKILNFRSTYLGSPGSLYEIDYSVVPLDPRKEGGSDGLFIKRMVLIDDRYKRIISFDRHGKYQETPLRCSLEAETDISFNVGGISSYKETLERLYEPSSSSSLVYPFLSSMLVFISMFVFLYVIS